MRAVYAALAVLSVATNARADQPRATAVELFSRGRALASQNKCAEAIPFFLDTLKLEASVGALLNLADCHDKLGDASSAFARYKEAEGLAREKHDDREALARGKWQALVSRVPKLSVVATAGIAVRIDGVEARDTLPVSAGDHEVSATAPGRRTWTTRVHAEGAGVITVQVPELALLPPDEHPVPPSVSVSPGGGEGRVAGGIITVTGVVVLAVAGVSGGVALAYKNDAQTLSIEPGKQADFNDARTTAKTFADTSTVLFVVGGILAAAGLTIWLVSPHARLAVSASLGSVGLAGCF